MASGWSSSRSTPSCRPCCRIVDGQPDIDIVAEARDVDDAIATIRDQTPDVVLVDTELPISLVVAAVQRLKRECPSRLVAALPGTMIDAWRRSVR